MTATKNVVLKFPHSNINETSLESADSENYLLVYSPSMYSVKDLGKQTETHTKTQDKF